MNCPSSLAAGKSKMRLQHAHGIHHQNKLYDANQAKRKNTNKSKKAKVLSEASQETEIKTSEE